jgi:hypothetical protein
MNAAAFGGLSRMESGVSLFDVDSALPTSLTLVPLKAPPGRMLPRRKAMVAAHASEGTFPGIRA